MKVKVGGPGAEISKRRVSVTCGKHWERPFFSPQDTDMTQPAPRRIGFSIEVRPHAYDPMTQPELFDGVLARRVIAFLIDLTIIGFPVLVASLFIFLFGIVTLGLGWLLFWLLSPAAVIWGLAYYGLTFGSPASATIGMRMVGIEMRTWYGAPAYALLGMVHAILYWILVSTLTPLILLVGFFNERRRLLHDFLVGTVVINDETRAASLRREPPYIT
jgi:uncharacterized RDD family membrane protein YckC